MYCRSSCRCEFAVQRPTGTKNRSGRPRGPIAQGEKEVELGVAKLPLGNEIADFDFKGTPINESLVRDLAAGSFLTPQRNAVFVGGTGTGKTHLAIAIGRNCVRAGKRGRFYNAVDLVNRLQANSAPSTLRSRTPRRANHAYEEGLIGAHGNSGVETFGRKQP